MVRKREEQTIGDDPERCCISWTGGKDCNLALLKCWRDPSLHVTDLVVFRPDSTSDFEAHPKDIMEAQAESLGLTLRFMTIPSNIPYKEGYVNAIKKLRDEHGISVITTGDMDLVDAENNPENFIKECCAMAGGGIRTYLPLWKANREECLTTLVLQEGYKIVLSCVKSPWFDESWCGKTIDPETFREMMQKSEEAVFEETEMEGPNDPRRKPLDLGGENGEYHSMVLDGPLYQYGIEIVEVATEDIHKGTERKPIQIKSTITGKAENGMERWWTYTGQTRWSLGKFEIKRRIEGKQ